MEFIPLRGRIFLLVMVFLLIIIFAIISCRTNAANTTGSIETVSATPTPDLRNLVVKTVDTSVYQIEETILTDKDGGTLLLFQAG